MRMTKGHKTNKQNLMAFDDTNDPQEVTGKPQSRKEVYYAVIIIEQYCYSTSYRH